MVLFFLSIYFVLSTSTSQFCGHKVTEQCSEENGQYFLVTLFTMLLLHLC